MRTSESIASIAPAFVAAQAAMEAAIKSKVGKIQGREGRGSYEYSYSDLATVIDAVRPALNANGIGLLQWVTATDSQVIATTRLQHVSGEWYESDFPVPANAPTPQAMGSASTYAKRYGVQALCGLPSEDDDGKRANDEQESTLAKRAAQKAAADAVASAPPSPEEVEDALMALAEIAPSGVGALQAEMENLRPALRDHLRHHERAKLASIKVAATPAKELA